MGENECPQCGAPIYPGATECKYCGEKILVQNTTQQYQQPYSQNTYSQQPQPKVIIQQAPPQTVYVPGINPMWPMKNRILAGIVAIFLGGFGVHKFYLGKTGMGILYFIFSWAGLPWIIGFIEGVLYLCSNDDDFMYKHHVRVR